MNLSNTDNPYAAPPNFNDPPTLFFEYEHLPRHLQDVSIHFRRVYDVLKRTLPPSHERSVALRKLLEAKDCAVRAALIAHQNSNDK